MGIALPQLAPASEDRVSGAQVIDGSLRFDQSKSQYLKFTPTTTGNRRTWTFSCWFRKMEESANRVIFSSYGSGATPWTAIQTTGNDDGRIQATFDAGVSSGYYTDARYRDNGWYHLVWTVDTTQPGDPNKSKVYINGELQTYGANAHPSLNEETKFNLAGTTMYIGYTPNQLFDGHMSQCYFLDGLAIGPGYFGYTDPLTGTWRPKKFRAEGTTVNNGTNWSAGLTAGTADGSGAIGLMFDGDTTDGSWSDSSGYSISFPNGGVTATNNIKIYGGSGSANWYVYLNGIKTTINAPGGAAPAWSATGVTGYVDLGPGTLTSIGTEGSGIAQNGEVSGIEIDGVLMRDSTTQNLQFGTNGFYFPMDGNSSIGEDKSGASSPNDGTIWSSYFTGSHDASNGWGTLYEGSNAFDGNLSTAAIGDENATGLTWTAPGGAIGANATTIRIYGNDDNCPDDYLKINGINYGGLITQGFGPDWTVLKGAGAVGGGITQLESIYIRDNGAGNTHYRWRALEIDGVVLVDGRIGNSWTPVNFDGSSSIEKATGAKPILNTINGGTTARPGVFGSDVSAVYATTSASNSGGQYYFSHDSSAKPTFSFIRGATYTFDYSASSSHPLRFATAADAAGSTEYTDGTSISGNVIKFTVPHNAPDTLYYYCNVHNGMGNSISVTTDETKADPYAWKNVLALPLVGNEDDVSNSINCTSTAKATSNNNASASNAQSNFYGGTYYFDGSNDYITPTANADFAFGTGDFTAEAWFYANDTGDYRTIIDARTSGASSSTGWIIGRRNNKKIYVYSNGFILESTSLPEIGSWYHVAFVRSGSAETLYINGVAEATSSSSRNYSDQNSRIGGEGYSGGGGSFAWNGYISDVRLYKGVAKYTSDFIPASPTPGILPDTPSGVATKSKLTKITDGAVTFDGSGDYLSTTSSSSDFTFGTGDFTIEMFLYNRETGGKGFIQFSDSSGGLKNTSSGVVTIHKDAGQNGVFRAYAKNASTAFSTPVPYKRWCHVALVRESGTIKLFVDGKQDATTISSDTTNYAATYVAIGGYYDTSYLSDCVISNVRVNKGTALYTSNFTPPTEPLTNVTNTKLLTCQTPTTYQIAAVAPLVSGVNNGTVWSSSVAPGSAFRSGFPATYAFNGTTKSNTNQCTATPQQQGQGFTFTFEEGVPFTTLQMQCDDNNGGKVFVNGVDITSQLPTGSLTNTTITGVTSPLTSIRLISTTGDALYLGSVTIDGTMLVDPLVPNGNAVTTNFNPFNTDINTIRGQEGAYATLNPLINGAATLSDGNLTSTAPSGNTHARGRSTLTMDTSGTGKFYFEATLIVVGGSYAQIGVMDSVINTDAQFVGGAANGYSYANGNGQIYVNGSGSSYADTYTAGDTIGCSFDCGSGALRFYKNGVDQGLAATITADYHACFAVSNYGSSGKWKVNFGQKPFKFQPPDGFQPLTLSTARPDTIVANSERYFEAVTYTGNGSTQSISGLKFGAKPDFVWIKQRSTPDQNHALFDSIRGPGHNLSSSTNHAERSDHSGATGDLTSFDVNGFSLGSSAASGARPVNLSGKDIVAWCWKAGGSAGTFNIDDVGYANASDANMSIGSLNSSFYNTSETWSSGLSALSGSLTNPPNAFDGDVGTYADSTAGFTLDLTGHTFGTGAHTIEVKSGGATSFMVVGATSFGFLTDPGGGGAKIWTGTFTGEIYSIISSASGASVYYVKIDGKILVNSGTDLSSRTQYPSIAPTGSSVGTKQGFSIIGYTGTGNNGTLPHGLSQPPEFVILKGRNFADNWRVYHKDLDATNPANYYLMLESTNGKSSLSTNIFNQTMPTNSVFSLGTDSAVNGDTRTMIAYLWHSVPGLQKFGKYTGNLNADGPFIELGFRPALVWLKEIGNAGYWNIYDNKRNTSNLTDRILWANDDYQENDTDIIGSAGSNAIDFLSNGFKLRSNKTGTNRSGGNYIYCAWAEAPAFNLFGAQSNAR